MASLFQKSADERNGQSFDTSVNTALPKPPLQCEVRGCEAPPASIVDLRNHSPSHLTHLFASTISMNSLLGDG